EYNSADTVLLNRCAISSRNSAMPFSMRVSMRATSASVMSSATIALLTLFFGVAGDGITDVQNRVFRRLFRTVIVVTVVWQRGYQIHHTPPQMRANQSGPGRPG